MDQVELFFENKTQEIGEFCGYNFSNTWKEDPTLKYKIHVILY